MPEKFSRLPRLSGLFAAALSCLLLTTGAAQAQSNRVDYPTPVFSNEIAGRIAPRDLGDARLTRHFYAFNGTEGDLVLTVEGSGLDGTVDLFAAAALRPLARVMVYAGATPTRVTRSVYLQRGEPLVLRVEGRAAGDAEGTYRVRLEGAFAPASGQSAPAPELPDLAADAAGGRRGGRVNAAGARIGEPESERRAEETAAAPAAVERPTETTEATPEANASAPRTPPRARAPRAASRGTRGGSSPGAGARRPEPAEPGAAATARTRRPARRPARRAPRAPSTVERGAATESSPSAGVTAPGAAPAPVVTATRLVIETKDGSRIERDMSGVRRVSVENNVVVVFGRDGRVQRIPLAEVSRMSIEP